MRAPRQAIQLTGRVVEIAGTRFAETAASEGSESAWLPTGYLYLAEAKSAAGKRNADGEPVEADGSVRKWIHFSIGQGTLVSYVGDRPVFATLASPGIGGVPAIGADPLDTRTTPVGTYRIHFKHVSDDMSPEQTEHRKFWIADVPYAMYFQATVRYSRGVLARVIRRTDERRLHQRLSTRWSAFIRLHRTSAAAWLVRGRLFASVRLRHHRSHRPLGTSRPEGGSREPTVEEPTVQEEAVHETDAKSEIASIINDAVRKAPSIIICV